MDPTSGRICPIESTDKNSRKASLGISESILTPQLCTNGKLRLSSGVLGMRVSLTIFVVVLLVSGPVGSSRLPSIQFEEIAEKAGLRFRTANSPTTNKNQIETMVAGVALLDYDRDGYLDVYLVNGAAIPSLKKDSPIYWNRLFHNNQDGTFTDVTERAGVAGAGYGMGAAVGDYDNDGWPDLFVANVTGNQLFHNNGDGTFSEVTGKAGVAGAQLD